MKKFLIEVPHSAEEIPCARVVKNFLELGSHLLGKADWGCMDGVHKLWLIIEADSKEEARLVLPPVFRPEALIVELNAFTIEEMDRILGTTSESNPVAR